MTSLNRVVIEWSGSCVVGRAVTVLHYSASDNVAPPVAAIRAAFSSQAAILPSGVSVQVPGSGDVINDADGSLVGVWSAATPAVVTGGGVGSPAAGVGACIGWTTGGIVNGAKGPRKLRGRTFIVPLAGNAYESNGTLTSAYLGSLDDIASQLQAAGPLAIWHRPTSATATDGNSYGVISHKVRDKVAFLSSRRD